MRVLDSPKMNRDSGVFGEDGSYPTECWVYEWRGDYPTGSVNGKTVRLHRIVYMRHFGPTPKGMTIDHLCRTKNCLRPDHLEAVSSEENIRRSHYWRVERKYPVRGQVTPPMHVRECGRGHDLSEPDSYHAIKGGQRKCKICTKIAADRRKLNTKTV